MGALIEVDVLGPLEVSVDSRPIALGGARTQLLFCRLLLAAGRPVADDRLRDDVWDGTDGSGAALKVAVSRLRAALGPASDAVRRVGHGYALVRTDVVGDVDRFESLVAEARATDEPLAAADLVARALGLWRGEPYEGLGPVPFLLAEIEQLTSRRHRAEEDRFDALVAAGRHREVLADLEAAAAARPASERLAMALARTRYRTGHQLEALDALRRTERGLREVHGLSPTAAFRQLEHAVLTHDPSLTSVSVTPTVAAASEADRRLQIAVASRAADALVSAGATAEAARLAARALDVARGLGDPSETARALARLGRMLSLAERGEEVTPLLDEAAAIARSAGDAAALARVAMARFGMGLVGDDPDGLLALLAEPLALLPDDAPECVDLLCAAMHQLVQGTDSPSADTLLQRAELLADRVGDPRAVAVARIARAVLAPLRGAPLEDQRLAAGAALDAVEHSGDATLRVVALHGRVRSLLEAGRVDDVAALLDDFGVAARQSQYPFAWLRTRLLANSVDLARGDLDGVEGRIADTLALGRRMGVASAAGTTLLQFAVCWMEQGRHAEIAAFAAARVANDATPWEGLHVLMLAHTGAVDEARAGLRAATSSRRWATIVDASRRRYVPALLAEAASMLGAADDAAVLAEALEPDAGRFLVLGHATSSYGPVDRVRGLALGAAGRHDDAVAALTAAHALADAGGARLWAERSALDLAVALVARHAPGDAAQAATLVAGVRSSPLLAVSARLAAELAVAEAASA